MSPEDWRQDGGPAVVPGMPHAILPQVAFARTEGQVFRERVGFLFLCVIGAYCSMRILVDLKSILEPFCWGLFLVMAWKPVVDGLERRIEHMLATACTAKRGPAGRATLGDAQEDGELEPMVGECDDMEDGGEFTGCGTGGSQPKYRRGPRDPEALASAAEAAVCHDIDGEAKLPRPRPGWRRAAARSLAVLTATLGMLGLLSGFGLLILESARHMRDNWDIYKKGAEKLTRDTQVLFQKVPESFVRQYQDVSANMVKTAQDILYGLLGDFVNNVSSLLFGVLLTLLYTLFWLCSPVPMDSSIDVMFRKYIMFKTLACFGYGVCVGLLLAALSIDLASVFALTTFALNYMPEVGPFVAMILPCPIILLDSRLERPFLVLLSAVLGQLALKFAFSNIIEVKLIESDKKLRMHPVMILLSVGIFGHLWGPTGMLLSVPLMALMKISLFSELVPSSYRDPILIVLEGDRDAPMKHGLLPDRAASGSGSGLRLGRGVWAAPGG
mmetsp:Transcript_78863/g.221079  ORF Transcript_78863/g.221079 Transcript_78863/m.221079 type:complete len:499 (+) Transcript_78863:527-2023(+)